LPADLNLNQKPWQLSEVHSTNEHKGHLTTHDEDYTEHPLHNSWMLWLKYSYFCTGATELFNSAVSVAKIVTAILSKEKLGSSPEVHVGYSGIFRKNSTSQNS
jgi:hypothetical protein